MSPFPLRVAQFRALTPRQSPNLNNDGVSKFMHTPSPSAGSTASFLASPASSRSIASSQASSTTTEAHFWTTTKTLEQKDHLCFRKWKRPLLSRLFLLLLSILILYIMSQLCRSPSVWLGNVEVQKETFNLIDYTTHPHMVGKEDRSAKIDPARWLEQNSNNKYARIPNQDLWKSIPAFGHASAKPRAALISLVRNSELPGLLQSMQQLEHRWNSKYNYPWIFFNDEPFNEEFMAATRNVSSAPCYYEVVPKQHWSLPDWIDEGRFMNSLEYLGAIGVGKGWMISYRHMCRWNSGFFYKHPRLAEFDWYWRVEPDVHFFCDIDYDVFRFMRDNKMKYGFNMNILDDARSFPSLWERTRSFINAYPDMIHQDADLDWLLDPHNSGDYNNCQFFSNFEVGSLDFFRGKENEKYFDWLDRGGGFFYERFGDAPIHTLSVAMFVPKEEIWYFRDIGYQHDINRHCPPFSSHRCSCEPTKLDENFYKLVPLESPQRKPDDTCIRQFLGGRWLDKKSDWSQDGERAFGGDGYHGYVHDGLS